MEHAYFPHWHSTSAPKSARFFTREREPESGDKEKIKVIALIDGIPNKLAVFHL